MLENIVITRGCDTLDASGPATEGDDGGAIYSPHRHRRLSSVERAMTTKPRFVALVAAVAPATSAGCAGKPSKPGATAIVRPMPTYCMPATSLRCARLASVEPDGMGKGSL